VVLSKARRRKAGGFSYLGEYKSTKTHTFCYWCLECFRYSSILWVWCLWLAHCPRCSKRTTKSRQIAWNDWVAKGKYTWRDEAGNWIRAIFCLNGEGYWMTEIWGPFLVVPTQVIWQLCSDCPSVGCHMPVFGSSLPFPAQHHQWKEWSWCRE
jgi:hypothetical protein